MPWGSWVNELPTEFFMAVHIAAFKPVGHGGFEVVLADARPVAAEQVAGIVIAGDAVARQREQHLTADRCSFGSQGFSHVEILSEGRGRGYASPARIPERARAKIRARVR